jgi:tetratricopeptide (TPR) repeat protein
MPPQYPQLKVLPCTGIGSMTRVSGFHAAELARLGGDFVAGSQGLPPLRHALALSQAGFILVANGDPARARQLLEQTLPLYKQDNEKPAVSVTMNALVLAYLCQLAARRRDDAAASKLLDQAQALLRELRDDDPTGFGRLRPLLTVAIADNALGQIRLDQGDNDAAAHLFTDALAVARRAQDRVTLLTSLYDLALARQAQGDLAGAAGHLQDGLALAAQAGDETSAAYYLQVLAAVAGQQDNRSVPYACSPPPAPSWTPAAAAGCTPSCHASRTTMRSWPRCAPRSATRHSRRPRHGAGPPGANARWNSHSRKPPSTRRG